MLTFLKKVLDFCLQAKIGILQLLGLCEAMLIFECLKHPNMKMLPYYFFLVFNYFGAKM